MTPLDTRQGRLEKQARKVIPALPQLSFRYLMELVRQSLLLKGGRPSKPSFPFTEGDRVRMTMQGRYAVFWAVRMALEGSRGGQRDVLIPAYHHGVEVDAVLAAGGRPVFFRVDRNMGTHPDDVERAITSRTKVVLLVHHCGMPASVKEVAELCRDRGICLVEDCAHSLWSQADGAPLGSFGDLACFSLHKVLPVPDGGVLTWRKGWDATRLPASTRPPMTGTVCHVIGMLLGARMGVDPEELACCSPEKGVHSALDAAAVGGGTLRPSDMGAWLLEAGRTVAGLAGLRPPAIAEASFSPSYLTHSSSWATEWILFMTDPALVVEARYRHYHMLVEALETLVPPLWERLPSGVSPLCYPLVVGDKDRALARLRSLGVAAIDLWREPHNTLARGQFPEADWLREHVVEIPLHQDLNGEEVRKLVPAILDAVMASR